MMRRIAFTTSRVFVAARFVVNGKSTVTTKAEKQNIIDKFYQRYLLCEEVNFADLSFLFFDLNDILQNGASSPKSEESGLSSLSFNRGRFFQASACTDSFFLLISSFVMRVCGHQIHEQARESEDLERAYLEVAIRLFFHLSSSQRRDMERMFSKLKIIWSADEPLARLELADYFSCVIPQRFDTKNIVKLVQNAFVYEDLMQGIPHTLLSLKQVRSFIDLFIMCEAEGTVIDSCFGLVPRMKEKLLTYRKMSDLERIQHLIVDASERGQILFSKMLPLSNGVENRVHVLFARGCLPSRINDLALPIEQIQAKLAGVERTLSDPVSSFKVQFFYGESLFSINTAGSVYPGKLPLCPQNSKQQIDEVLRARASKIFEAIFLRTPSCSSSSSSSTRKQRVLIDLRAVTRYSETHIFDKHAEMMLEASYEHDVVYFPLLIEAHSTLDRVLGMVHKDEFLDFSQTLKETINVALAQIKEEKEDYPKFMDAILKKWNDLCNQDSLRHQRNAIPFVALTGMLCRYINENSFVYEIELNLGCKVAKDRTFSILTGVNNLFCVISHLLQTSQSKFSERFENLFSADGYFDWSRLDERGRAVLLESFCFELQQVSNEVNEGIKTNVNQYVYWAFFKKVKPFYQSSAQTASLLDLKR